MRSRMFVELWKLSGPRRKTQAGGVEPGRVAAWAEVMRKRANRRAAGAKRLFSAIQGRETTATGGTMAAAVTLLESVGGIVPAAACIIELTFLDGRKRLKVPVETLLKYDT